MFNRLMFITFTLLSILSSVQASEHAAAAASSAASAASATASVSSAAAGDIKKAKETKDTKHSNDTKKADFMDKLSELPDDIGHAIALRYNRNIQLKTQRYRAMLLPAVVRYRKIFERREGTIDFKDYEDLKIFTAHASGHLQESFKNYRKAWSEDFNKRVNKTLPKTIIAVYFVESSSYAKQFSNMRYDATTLRPLPINVKDSPKDFLDRALQANEVAYLVWSDGTQQIALSTIDLEMLYALSDEQFDFIIHLYRRLPEDRFSETELKIFQSLNPTIRSNLMYNYQDLFNFSRKSADKSRAVVPTATTPVQTTQPNEHRFSLHLSCCVQ